MQQQEENTAQPFVVRSLKLLVRATRAGTWNGRHPYLLDVELKRWNQCNTHLAWLLSKDEELEQKIRPAPTAFFFLAKIDSYWNLEHGEFLHQLHIQVGAKILQAPSSSKKFQSSHGKFVGKNRSLLEGVLEEGIIAPTWMLSWWKKLRATYIANFLLKCRENSRCSWVEILHSSAREQMLGCKKKLEAEKVCKTI